MRDPRIEDLFVRALEVDPERREAFLKNQAAGDGALLDEVRSLLSAHDDAGSFLGPAPGEGAERSDVGQMAGPYKLLRRIASGGMGDVYLAARADETFRKRVAIKVIRERLDRDDVVRRFRTERQILAGLDHPNIARLLDGGTLEDGRPFFAIEYIEGVPLDVYCDRERLSIERRLDLFRSICSAVQYAHTNLVVHRDIKPSNILVSDDGVAKLLDFGIAKLLKPDQFATDVELTKTQHRPMTPRWASPEQIAGRTVTTASDVYSLGLLLYHLLTGRFPYADEGSLPGDFARVVLETDPERPSESIERQTTAPAAKTSPETSLSSDARPSGHASPDDVARARSLTPAQLRRRLRGDLDNIAMMALRKEVHRRYASVDQLAEDVRRHLDGLPVSARPDTFGYRTAKFVRRHTAAAVAVAGFVALMVASAIFFAFQSARIATERDEARRERDRAETVLGLMEGIFAVSDPWESSGEPLGAREILERGARQVRQELAEQPEARASLLRSIGNVQRNLGNYEEARSLLEEALRERAALFDDVSAPVAESYHDLGVTLRDAKEFDASQDALDAALERRESLFGAGGAPTLSTKLALGLLEYERSDYHEAQETLGDVITAWEAKGDVNDDLATAKSYLGIAAAETGDLARSEVMARAVVDLRRRLHPDGNPKLADAINDVGVICGIRGNLDDSKRFLTEALDLRLKFLDADHPLVAESYNNLGRVNRELTEWEASERYYRQAIDIYRDRLGAVSPSVAAGLSNLASLKIATGDLDEAEQLARESLEMRRATLDPRSYHVGTSMVILGGLLVDREAWGEACPLLGEAVDVISVAMAPDHWRAGSARIQLARCEAGRGRDDVAEALFREGLTQLEGPLGPEHRRTQDARAAFAAYLESRGREDEVAGLNPS